MNLPAAFARHTARIVFSVAVCLVFCSFAQAQIGSNERVFPYSKTEIEQALKDIQPSLAGRLPVLEGFAVASDHPLERYQRGYYQSTVEITPGGSGGSVVHVTAKVTAWYADPIASRSGYKALTSNGRLETDVLDQLADRLAALATKAPKTPAANILATSPNPPTHSAAPPMQAEHEKPLISAPLPRLPDTGGTFSSSLAQSLAAQDSSNPRNKRLKAGVEDDSDLKAEADSLEEILKNQAHPKNLVAVRKSGTAVVPSPSLTAKPLFLASEHDEFELLEFNPNWVHVRISGLSRGWIWRSNVEMPEGIPDNDTAAGRAPNSGELFRVSRQETAPFPGDWEPLRGKNVKIVSVQKTDDAAPDAGVRVRLEFVKFVLDKTYAEISQKSPELAGIVVIFDSADGGMIAATVGSLQKWKAGTLSDAALWHQCFFDPPEAVDSGTGGQ